MAKITDVDARLILDSRGVPTLEGQVILDHQFGGFFKTPSGASVGKLEACELRDGDPNVYFGKGVNHAIANVKTVIKSALIGKDFDQESLDRCLIELDGTNDKSRLGANSLLAVSGAFFHASAKLVGRPLYDCWPKPERFVMPMPLINVINGGVHANNGLDIQEFMIVPVGAKTFHDAMRQSCEVFQKLKSLLKAQGLSTAVGDEGGFAPQLRNNEAALELLKKAVEEAGYHCGDDFQLALDVAANEIYDKDTGTYQINGAPLSSFEMLDWYKKLVVQFPICSIEDPFCEDDREGFNQITESLGGKIQVVGDDLFVTNAQLIAAGANQRLANAALIKMNQVGTISETLDAIRAAKAANMNTIISHRSGDTEDTTIADLAVLTRAGQIKTGSLCRAERTAKYNRLLGIAEDLGERATYPTKKATP